MSLFLIYALHHPSSQRVYVGKSSSGMVRPREHGAPSHLKNPRFSRLPVCKWIAKRRAAGDDYEIAVLEECESIAALDEAEMFHIAYFKAVGVSLLNCTDGGEQSPVSVPSIARRIGDKLRGRRLSDDHRRAIAIGVRAAMTDEYRAAMSNIKSGRPHSDVHRQRLSEAAHRRSTPEYRAHMAMVNRGRKPSPLAVERSVAARRAKRLAMRLHYRFNLIGSAS